MTWLYAVDKLKLPAVVDFGVGCGLVSGSSVPPPKAFNKRPDFMAGTAPLKNVVLLESKGMIVSDLGGVSWRGGLVDGLNQTAAGSDWLSAHGTSGLVTNKYAVSFALVENGRSVAVAVDPPDPTRSAVEEGQALALLQRHIAIWATAAGNLRLAAAFEDAEQTKARVQLVDALHTTEVNGFRLKSGFSSRQPWYAVNPIVHLISADLIKAAARGDFGAAINAIAEFNTRSDSLQEENAEAAGVRIRMHRDSLVCFPDGTASECLIGDDALEAAD